MNRILSIECFKMTPKLPILIVFSLLLFVQCGQEDTPSERPPKPNILFIAVDDLRPDLACYGADHIKTPNFDRLAANGMRFERAYCQQAVCAPSRNSLMTGLRPDALGIYDLYTFFREKTPDVITLPQLFKSSGYQTERMGKIYHTGHGNQDDSLSWSVPAWNLGEEVRKLAKIQRKDTIGLERDYPEIAGRKLPYYRSNEPESNMTDAMVANHAVARIEALKDTAFFLAVGFVKPHLPFVAPSKYWDLYDPAAISVPERKQPEGMASMALANFGELRKYHGIPAEGMLNDSISTNLIQGYYAAVSMIDAQLGKLLDALEAFDLAKNTIIVLWGDHGWKLGDYGNWCKHSNMELDARVPLFFSVPWLKKGLQSGSLAELVDIYPTLCDLAGIEKPAHLEGQSLLPILKDPAAIVKEVAISQYPRGKSLGYDRKNELMGYSIRTGPYRYTRWQQYEQPEVVVERELYDHSDSPLAVKNLVLEEGYAALIKDLDLLLDQELGKYTLKKTVPLEKR